MSHGSLVPRLVALAGSLALSALIIVQTSGLPLGSAQPAGVSLVTIA